MFIFGMHEIFVEVEGVNINLGHGNLSFAMTLVFEQAI
jgi:hypothetical protein